MVSLIDLSQPNIRNRLTLWVNALASVENSLLLAQRARDWSESPKVHDEVKKNGGISYMYSDPDPYASVRRRTFPILFECGEIVSVAMTSAIVYYCQLQTTGNADGQHISSNSKNLTSCLWQFTLKFLSNHGIDPEEVKTLNSAILDARDGMIAHADARVFDAKLDAKGDITSYRSYEHAWQEIDHELWLKITYLLKNEIFNISSHRS